MTELSKSTIVILCCILQLAGFGLSVAAFGKLYSKEYVSDDDKWTMIAVSFILWPICLLGIFASLLWQKTYKR